MAGFDPADIFWIVAGTLACLWGLIDVLIRRRQTARTQRRSEQRSPHVGHRTPRRIY